MKELIIEQTGREAIGIGCHENKASVHIENTKVSYDSRCSVSAFIGGHGVEAIVKNSDVDIVSFGDRVCGITTYSEAGSSVTLFVAKFKSIFRSKEVFIIGGPDSFIDTAVIDSTFDISSESSSVIAFGSNNKTGSISFYRCSGLMDIRSANGMLFGLPDEKIEKEQCDIKFETTV